MGASAPEAHARQLREEARGHMRAARRHRRQAKELMRQLEAVIAGAARRGIEINLNRPAQQGEPSGQGQEGTAGPGAERA